MPCSDTTCDENSFIIMPRRTDTSGYTKVFDFPVMDHCGEGRRDRQLGGLVYWGLTPQQQPGSYQGGEMMMKSVFCFQ